MIGGDVGTPLITLNGGGKIIMDGGGIFTDVNIPNLINGGFVNGGGTVELNGTNLVKISEYILAGVGAAPTADDLISVTLNGCPVNSDLTAFVEEEFSNYNHRFQAYQISKTSDTSIHQFHV